MISDLTEWPRAILLWRSVMQWLGGLGILVLFVALLSGSGGAKFLFRNESSFQSEQASTARIHDTALTLLPSLACLQVEAGHPAWQILAEKNALDIRLYEYIVRLFEEQRDLVASYANTSPAPEEISQEEIPVEEIVQEEMHLDEPPQEESLPEEALPDEGAVSGGGLENSGPSIS